MDWSGETGHVCRAGLCTVGTIKSLPQQVALVTTTSRGLEASCDHSRTDEGPNRVREELTRRVGAGQTSRTPNERCGDSVSCCLRCTGLQQHPVVTR